MTPSTPKICYWPTSARPTPTPPHRRTRHKEILTRDRAACNADYSEAVYEHVIKMFAANAFRPMPPAAYATSPLPPSTDTGSAVAPDLTMESAQSAAAYLAFGKFIDRQLFDPAKAEPHVDSRFVAALVHRWNSVDAAERTGAAETLYRLSDACRSVRAIAFAAVVHELADYAYGHASECRNGVDELFGFLIDVLHRVDSAPAAATVNQVGKLSGRNSVSIFFFFFEGRGKIEFFFF